MRDGSVEPTYPEHELESLIGLGDEVRVRIGVELLSQLGDKEAMNKLNERARVLRMKA